MKAMETSFACKRGGVCLGEEVPHSLGPEERMSLLPTQVQGA